MERWAGIFLSLIGIAGLIWTGLLHFRDGVAVDGAIPVPSSMIARKTMPQSAYRKAAAELRRADPADANAHEAGGEAEMHLGDTAAATADFLQALSFAPASVRAWVYLSRLRAQQDPASATGLFAQSLQLAPHDFWLAGERVSDAALLWDHLDATTRNDILSQTRMLWYEPALRPQLYLLLQSKAGIAMVTRAFAADQDELRTLNRWVSSETRRQARQDR